MKLTLLCHGMTASMRAGGFPALDEPLDVGAGLRLRPLVEGMFDQVFVSPGRAARQTAHALGADAIAVDTLRDIDHGSWAGRSFADVHAAAPAAFAGWLARPWDGTPDGETFADLSSRANEWMESLADSGQSTAVVTHPMVVRALLALAIGLPVEVTMGIDIAPLTAGVLSHHRGWRLQRLGERLFG